MLKDNTKTMGDLAEMKVACHLLEQGHSVSVPIGDNAPYDLIADINGKLVKIQVKARTQTNGRVEVQMESRMRNFRYAYTPEHWDILAVYNVTTNELAFLNWSDIDGRKGIILRSEAPKNNQSKGVSFFKDFKEIIVS